jgi:ubiquitin C-terminal hydrolase
LQEFCSTLLDKVHEDLNRVHQITPFEEENYAGLSASEASDRAWAAYQRLNDSIIVDLFQVHLP